MDAQEQRRLLELAAKAVGFIDDATDESGATGLHRGSDGVFYLTSSDGWREWAPYTDDGDAFRLACYFGLRVFTIARTESGAACSAVWDVTGERLSEIADMLPTRTATRLAIVRAAAAIGEKMGAKP